MDTRTDAQIAMEAMREQCNKTDKAAAMLSDIGSFVRTQLWEALNMVGYPAHGEMVQAPKKVCKLVNYIGEKWIDSLESAGTLRSDGEQSAIKMLLKDGKL